MKESDMYLPVKELFESKGYDVYAEVIVPYTGGRIDVVAAAPPSYTAIEMKTTLSVDLIQQAVDRKNVFPIVYIAIPRPKGSRTIAHWLLRYLKAEGIGIIYVHDTMYDSFAKIHLMARWKKPHMGRTVKLENILREEHKTWVEGGHSGGGYVTPYRLTMVGVKHYLSQARKGDLLKDYSERFLGWRSVAEIVEHCEMHYASPKSSLAKALIEIEGDWVEAKKEYGKFWFRIKGVSE